MKVIDLLNKIANKENLPKRIKYKGIVYGLKGTLYINDDETDRLMDFLYADFRNLNDEIEIIEDEEIDIQEIEELKELKYTDSYLAKDIVKPETIEEINHKITQILQWAKQIDNKIKK